MAEVISIDNEVVRLKEVGLLSAEANNQSRIDEISKFIILLFEEFKRKIKGKEV
jgi:hypothetical protein